MIGHIVATVSKVVYFISVYIVINKSFYSSLQHPLTVICLLVHSLSYKDIIYFFPIPITSSRYMAINVVVSMDYVLDRKTQSLGNVSRPFCSKLQLFEKRLTGTFIRMGWARGAIRIISLILIIYISICQV